MQSPVNFTKPRMQNIFMHTLLQRNMIEFGSLNIYFLFLSKNLITSITGGIIAGAFLAAVWAFWEIIYKLYIVKKTLGFTTDDRITLVLIGGWVFFSFMIICGGILWVYPLITAYFNVENFNSVETNEYKDSIELLFIWGWEIIAFGIASAIFSIKHMRKLFSVVRARKTNPKGDKI